MPETATPTTRDRLLDAAEEMIKDRGFAATSIDRIIENAGVTKGTFFYHFKTKNDLAHALIDRFAAGDREVLEANMARAEKLSDDPLQQLLIFVGLVLEVAEQLDAEPQPACLFATYCYESGLFDEKTRSVISDAMRNWGQVVGAKLREAVAAHPPKTDVDLDHLADMLTVILEGAYVMARSVRGQKVFAPQIRLYRSYLQLLFDV